MAKISKSASAEQQPRRAGWLSCCGCAKGWDGESMSALPPPPVGILVRPIQLAQAEALVRQLQQAATAGGGTAYVTLQSNGLYDAVREEAPPVVKVDSLIDLDVPMSEQTATDAADVCELSQQLTTIAEEKQSADEHS